MDILELTDGLTYRGEFTAVRQTYYVFEARDFYMVLSFSASKPGSGNFNLVARKAVQYVHARFAGKKGVTSNAVAARAHRTTHAPNALAALNILYVLAVTGGARKEGEGVNGQLLFRVAKAWPSPALQQTAAALAVS